MTGELDIAYDEEIARELQMQQWQEEEKKGKSKEDGDEKDSNEEKKGIEPGEESSDGEKEILAIEGVDMDALKKFIAKQVESFFDEKLSEIMNPAAWAAHEQ